MIEAKDSVLAQLIVSDRRLQSLCMLAGEKHIVVPTDSEAVFRRTLRKLGYGLPIVQDSRRKKWVLDLRFKDFHLIAVAVSLRSNNA